MLGLATGLAVLAVAPGTVPQRVSPWDHHGFPMGSQWVPNGFPMGSQWVQWVRVEESLRGISSSFSGKQEPPCPGDPQPSGRPIGSQSDVFLG